MRKTKLKKQTKKINYQHGGVDNILPIPKFIKNPENITGLHIYY